MSFCPMKASPLQGCTKWQATNTVMPPAASSFALALLRRLQHRDGRLKEPVKPSVNDNLRGPAESGGNDWAETERETPGPA